jgi:ferritin-like metal-binding protein YciE
MESQTDMDLFTQQLKSLWKLEELLIDNLPELIERATHPGLQKILAFHYAETSQHKVAIEAICKQLSIYPRVGGFDADIKKILKMTEDKMNGEDAQADAPIISGAIEIEEYEMAVYEQAAKLAKVLGFEGISKRLLLTYEEERQSYAKLKFLERTLVEKTAEIGHHATH